MFSPYEIVRGNEEIKELLDLLFEKYCVKHNIDVSTEEENQEITNEQNINPDIIDGTKCKLDYTTNTLIKYSGNQSKIVNPEFIKK